MGVLKIAGRKTLMMILQVFVIAAMFGMWYFTDKDNDTGLLALSILFICAFALGPGPIVWLYISEICNNKATSVATVTNWFWTLMVSILAPFLNDKWLLDGKTYILFGCLSIFVSAQLLFLNAFIGSYFHHFRYERDKG